MEKIEIQNAFKWVCKECGKLNYHPGVDAQLTPEERKSIESDILKQKTEENGGERPEWEPLIDLIMAPNEVKCVECLNSFEVYHSRNDDMNGDGWLDIPDVT